MRIGIDFGTSYSAAAAVIGGKIEIVKFKDQNQFRTAVFFPAAIPTIESFSISQEDERRVSSIISSFRKEEADNIKRAENARQEALKRPKDKQAAALAMVQNVKRRSDEEHRQTAISIIRREWLEKEQRHAREIIRDQGNALYGEDAIEAYIASPNGHLISSPKSMLGYRLHGNARRILLGVATDILSHIRDAAQRQFNTEVTSAVLGRPVKFRSSMA